MHEQPKKQPCGIGLLAHVSVGGGGPHFQRTWRKHNIFAGNQHNGLCLQNP